MHELTNEEILARLHRHYDAGETFAEAVRLNGWEYRKCYNLVLTIGAGREFRLGNRSKGQRKRAASGAAA